MNGSTLYVDITYHALFGEYPTRGTKPKERCVAVMEHWDGRKLTGNPEHEQAARMALCYIGLHWHITDRLPYSFERITERLRVLMPALGSETITGRTLQTILSGRHPSQYGQPSQR